jgi:DNA-binding winged helix-turn-helix (wHTH) protein
MRVVREDAVDSLLETWTEHAYDGVIVKDDTSEPSGELLSRLALMMPRPLLIWAVPTVTSQVALIAYEHQVIAVPGQVDIPILRALHERYFGACAARQRLSVAPGITLQLEDRVLVATGGNVSLRRGESDILLYLLEHRERWVSTARLRRAALQRGDAAGDLLVWRYISDLRKKLGTCADLLRSSRTRGYRLDAANRSVA